MFPKELVELAQKRISPYQTEGFVTGKGPLNPKIMFVGEAPGRNEIEKGEPFIGRAGDQLNEFMEQIGLTRDDVYITSVVRSRPYKIVEKTDKEGNLITKTPNRAPTKKEMLAHAPLLDYQIQHMNPSIIVTLGGIALKRLLGNQYKITEVHGQLLEKPIYQLKNLNENQYSTSEKNHLVFPTFHPASVFYRQILKETIYEDFHQLGEVLEGLEYHN
ncbi:uracil-DNA glycosylase [Pontibacillus yanchengensis]|uniref:Uracil-DNA glycosylase n=1 Tax=Pontibacillus yanchengensis Y32 TaxID=1385514 RepID=A0A0A2T8D3_9BACI|nr:uracil-DNA glycosylase [Pontibacillus yanchengensis]KGP71779.1 uracil-DNA glycosylase [Pontibacillus yanchengensis Y32]